MKDVFARLGTDFFSTILFIAIYLATDNVLLATGVAIAGAVAQVIYSRVKGKELGYMMIAVPVSWHIGSTPPAAMLAFFRKSKATNLSLSLASLSSRMERSCFRCPGRK